MNNFPALIAPVRHVVWGVPAVINFCAGGAGSILYGFSFMLPPGGIAHLGLSQVHLIRLFCVLLVLIGFAAVGVESRKPMNARFLLHHLRRSWMSLEVLSGLLFIIPAVLDILFPYKLFAFGALFMAMLLLLCQVMMVYDAKGMGAWNTRLVAGHALSSNLYLACGLVLIFCSLGFAFDPGAVVMVVLISLMVNHIVWWLLLRSQKPSDLHVALQPLITPMMLTFSIGVGHILPALIFMPGIGINMLMKMNFLSANVFALAGCMIITGGIVQKAGIILGANSLKSIRPGATRKVLLSSSDNAECL
jgi:DMSO reductase anchor subunit